MSGYSEQESAQNGYFLGFPVIGCSEPQLAENLTGLDGYFGSRLVVLEQAVEGELSEQVSTELDGY